MSENVQISYRSEAGYEHAVAEHVAIVNPTIPSESLVSGDSENMDTYVPDVVDKPDGTSLHVSEHDMHTAPRTSKQSRHEVQPKRRQISTVIWEPLLVPSEVDGKVEMVTALKRVDSNYISNPRANTKHSTAQIVKETKLSTSPRLDVRQSSSKYTNPSSKVMVSKGPADTEIKHFIKKKAPDIKISEQMGKAIAEKEAAILKEIEKAMKEANMRTKSVLSDKSMSVKTKSSEYSEQSKPKICLKVVPTQNVQNQDVVEAHDSVSVETDVPQDSTGPIDGVSEGEKDGTKLIQRSLKSVSDVARIQNVSRTSKTISSPAGGTVTKELHGLSKVSAIPGKVLASSSVIRPVTKEMQSVNKILNIPGTVIVTTSPSTVVTVPKEVQALNQVLCGPTTVLTSPTSTAVISARDRQTVNQVITLPVNTKSNPQILTETSGPRILLLAAPSGGSLPLLTPIIPATSIPIMHTPVMTTSRGSVEKREHTKVAENRAKRGKDSNIVRPDISAQFVKTESVNIEASGGLNILGKRHSLKKTHDESHRNITVSRESVTDNTQMSSSSQGMHISVDAQKSAKSSVAQSPSLAVAKGLKNNPGRRGDKTTLNKSGTNESLQKQETAKTNTASNVSVNVKTTLCTQQNLTQKSAKDPQKVDCNGESMDIDDESISEELDQGFVDDTRNITSQNLLISGETKDSTHAGGNKCHSREQKQKSPTKKSAQSKSSNLDSEIVLENRLQRIEQLYNEIPPVKSRISLSEEDFSKISDGFRDSMRVVKAVTASFKSLIGQSSSLRNKELAHSSCQTEAVDSVENDSTELVTEDKSDEVDADLILCRLCGGFFKKDSLVSLFGKLSKKKRLLSMLNIIVPHIPPVKECDGLPQQVCEACVEKLTLCHNIINQFLQADKELRQVLQDEKPCTSDSSHLEENPAAPSQNSQISSEENTISTNNLHSESCAFGDHSSGNEASTGCSKNSERSTHIQQHGEKRSRTLAGFESSNAEKSTSRHKPKRRRSKSPNRSKSLQTTKSSAPSKASSGCIDLSRLDPEFNDGFEVEWCLDEETIRSSMVSEEDVGSGVNEDSTAATARVSAEGTSDAGKVLSADSGIHSHIDFPLDQSASPQKKTKSDLENETSKLIDEVSKLSEMHTSVCESPMKSGTKQSLSAVRQENCDIQLNVLTQSPETIKCSSCPLSFRSKQEAFLHKVMQHEEDQADDPKTLGGTQDSSSAVKPKNIPEKQTGSLDSKKENESSEESIMCDQCGLPFPNEYSLHLHECVIHETTMNSQLIIKDSKGLEYKIINSKEALERESCKEIPEASLTDGKILVKCGNGMLWVNCSKFFSEEQMTAVQTSDLSGITYTNIENGTLSIVSSDQSVPNVDPQSIAKVQFAYKCDHCKQIFSGRSELLTHMQSHSMEEYNCTECGIKFRTMKALNNHIPSHVPLDRVCDECGLILPDSKKLIQHRKEHTHNLPHVCESCGKRFPNEQTLEVHETVHYSKKGPLACSLCRKCFFFKHSLVRHRSQHASNRLQKCSLCFRVLNSSDQLRKHVALHHLMKNFVCFCKQTFPSQKELVEHRYLKHSYAEIFCARNKVEIVESLPLHQCSVCLRVLNSKQSLLKHHVTSHSSTWPFYCIQCSRKYTSMYHLARHECHRKNTSAFQCRICGKAFQNKNIFKQHKVIHNNRKWRYICRHCGKAFQKSQSLVTHIMTHGGKKFLCPRCHQSCQDKEGLLKHYNNGSCQMKGKSLQ